MIIPVRCVTCGKMLADKWRTYQIKTGAREDDDEKSNKSKKKASSSTSASKTSGGAAASETAGAASRKQAMDELGLVRYCCRRHFLSQVELIERI